MTGPEFRSLCIGLGLTTVGQVARKLGISERAVNRCRAGTIAPTVKRLVVALERIEELERERRTTSGN